jgi:hypothetical protein
MRFKNLVILFAEWLTPRAQFPRSGHRGQHRAVGADEFERLLREEGLSGFIYDEEKDLSRFKDGQLTRSCIPGR